jgi:hypothetical protein
MPLQITVTAATTKLLVVSLLQTRGYCTSGGVAGVKKRNVDYMFKVSTGT